jgi:hypothetical protein
MYAHLTGLVLNQCERIMQIYAKNSKELMDALETSRLVQKAKFQARLNYHQERLAKASQQNREMYGVKMKVEKKYLK